MVINFPLFTNAYTWIICVMLLLQFNNLFLMDIDQNAGGHIFSENNFAHIRNSAYTHTFHTAK